LTDIAKIVDDLSKEAPGVLGLVSKTATFIYRKRLEEARKIIVRKMGKGQTWRMREDAVLSLTFDFLRAAADGAAQDNLEVMADLIANGVAEEGLAEQAVRDLMRVVRDLSYEEMRALAALLRAQATYRPPPDLNEPPTKFYLASAIYNLAWRELAGSEHEEPPDEIAATFGALMRTGLIYSRLRLGRDEVRRHAEARQAGEPRRFRVVSRWVPAVTRLGRRAWDGQ